MDTSKESPSPVTDLAYYFTDWIWRSESIDFMKSMLLFFDGLTLALPSDIAAEMISSDPILATPLAELGILVNFDPVSTLDTASAERLAMVLTSAVRRDPRNVLGSPFSRKRLVSAHWGRGVARSRTVHALERELAERGLFIPGPRPGLYEMHVNARTLVLTLFAQTLRDRLEPQGINLHLATNSDSTIQTIAASLNLYLKTDDALNPLQLTSDLCDVGADLSAVSLDEVLSFRKENGQHYRAYAKGLRELLASLAYASPAERQQILQDRKSDIRDQASDLRRMSRRAFGTQTATLLLSLAGSAWTLHTGDPVGAILAGASASLQAIPGNDQSVTAYSYLLRTRDLRG